MNEQAPVTSCAELVGTEVPLLLLTIIGAAWLVWSAQRASESNRPATRE